RQAFPGYRPAVQGRRQPRAAAPRARTGEEQGLEGRQRRRHHHRPGSEDGAAYRNHARIDRRGPAGRAGSGQRQGHHHREAGLRRACRRPAGSRMTEEQRQGPRAHGGPCGSAVLKAVAEDFQVDEVLDIPLSGEGEHLWLWVEKRNLNTEEAARRIARATGVPLRSISYAGLKDRQALTRQWFSLHLPGKADPVLDQAEDETLKILKT